MKDTEKDKVLIMFTLTIHFLWYTYISLKRMGFFLGTQAETSHKWNLIVEANQLRARGKQKRREADDAKKEAEVIAKSRNKHSHFPCLVVVIL